MRTSLPLLLLFFLLSACRRQPAQQERSSRVDADRVGSLSLREANPEPPAPDQAAATRDGFLQAPKLEPTQSSQGPTLPLEAPGLLFTELHGPYRSIYEWSLNTGERIQQCFEGSENPAAFRCAIAEDLGKRWLPPQGPTGNDGGGEETVLAKRTLDSQPYESAMIVRCACDKIRGTRDWHVAVRIHGELFVTDTLLSFYDNGRASFSLGLLEFALRDVVPGGAKELVARFRRSEDRRPAADGSRLVHDEVIYVLGIGASGKPSITREILLSTQISDGERARLQLTLEDGIAKIRGPFGPKSLLEESSYLAAGDYKLAFP